MEVSSASLYTSVWCFVCRGESEMLDVTSNCLGEVEDLDGFAFPLK